MSDEEITITTIKKAMAFFTGLPGGWMMRPRAEEAYVIHWSEADVVIPWPEGVTPKQAILAWAKAQHD